MKHSKRGSSIFLNLTLLAGLVAIWIAFGPVQMGGQATYVIVNGVSMEPAYHTGDLVIVRKTQAYRIGDVVSYRDAELGAHIIHRIIGLESGHFILKGDNNAWIDTYQPTSDEIIGKQWIHIQRLGAVLQWFHLPINLALTMLLLGGVFMTSMTSKSPKVQKGKNRTLLSLSGSLEGSLYLLGFFALGFLGLSIYSFAQVLTRSADTIPYTQVGNYSYSAKAPPGVYDNGTVSSGEPIFPGLTCLLNIGFTYVNVGSQFENVSGSHSMYARVLDEQSGWQRTVPLIPQTTFVGNTFFVTSTLDLCQLRSMVDIAEKQSGLHVAVYSVAIITDVDFKANVPGQVIEGTFAPSLAFQFDRVHLYLGGVGNVKSNPMQITQQGVADSSKIVANTLNFLKWKPTVGFIRVFAVLGLAVSLGGLVILGWFIINTGRQSQEALIRLRYGPLLMEVYEGSLGAERSMIDVLSIDDLAKLAERQNTMILHMTLNFLHCYLVQAESALYRYTLSASEEP